MNSDPEEKRPKESEPEEASPEGSGSGEAPSDGDSGLGSPEWKVSEPGDVRRNEGRSDEPRSNPGSERFESGDEASDGRAKTGGEASSGSDAGSGSPGSESVASASDAGGESESPDSGEAAPDGGVGSGEGRWPEGSDPEGSDVESGMRDAGAEYGAPDAAPGDGSDSDGSSSGREASPRRLHPSSMLFEALKTARSWASAAAIPSIAVLFGSGLSVWVIALVLFGISVLLVVSAVWGFLSWRATSYWVSGGAFHLRSGVLQKNERTIPLDHVQSVDTVQGFVQRIIGSVSRLKVVEVRIETAGGAATETDASLAALTRDDAASLRREVEGARRGTFGVEEEEVGPTVIRKLTTRELLIAGATSGQIGAAAALIGVGSQFFDDFIDSFLSRNFVEGIAASIAPYAFLAVALIVFAVGLFAWFLAIAGTVVAYSGFTISRSADGKYLNIKRGFIRRYEATIPISRIQAVRITEGLLRQPFGLAMLRVESAGYGGGTEDVGVSTTLFPLIPRRQIRSFLEETAPEFAVEPDLTPLPKRAARRYIFRATAPWIIIFTVAGMVFFTSGLSVSVGPLSLGLPGVPLPPTAYFAIPAAVILFLAALYGWAGYRAAGWAMAEDCFVSRSRTLARTTAIAPRKRLQSRNIVRSPFQRRVRLATLRTRVASGSGGATFEVVDMESSSAREIIERLGPRKP